MWSLNYDLLHKISTTDSNYFLNVVDIIFLRGAEMKTYFKITLVGWAWLGAAVFGIICWALIVEHVISPVVRAVVG